MDFPVRIKPFLPFSIRMSFFFYFVHYWSIHFCFLCHFTAFMNAHKEQGKNDHKYSKREYDENNLMALSWTLFISSCIPI